MLFLGASRWDTLYQNNVKEYRGIGLICINSKKMWNEKKEPYVHPKHYNQVLFNLDALAIRDL